MSSAQPDRPETENLVEDGPEPGTATVAREVDRPGDDEAELTDERRRDLLGGGDAASAPHSLSQTERHPIEGDSSGTSWDDPDEL